MFLWDIKLVFTTVVLFCWFHSCFNNSLLLVSSYCNNAQAYLLRSQRQTISFTTTLLHMSKARNKQADLARKLELAKQQKKQQQHVETTASSSSSSSQQPPPPTVLLSPAEIKKQNDRLRFEELLRRQGATSALNDYSKDGYLNQMQEEEEIDAQRAGIDRLYEGDVAPTTCFEELVSVYTENAIGKSGAERIVPWLHKNPDRRQSDYLIVVCDPRMKSPELRQTIQQVSSDLSKDVLSMMIVINADSPAENRRWIKKNHPSESLEIFSDEKMEWMRAYTALGDKRWSMTMFLLANERVQKLARDVDGMAITRVIQNAIKSYQTQPPF